MSEGVGTSGRRKTITKKAHCIWVCLYNSLFAEIYVTVQKGFFLIRTGSKLSSYKFD